MPSKQMSQAEWRPLSSGDLNSVNEISNLIYKWLPERPEVFEEKFNLWPSGCFALAQHDSVVGYGITHPWMLHNIPPLDEFLGKIPEKPDCMYIHDVAILKKCRGQNAAARFLDIVRAESRRYGLSKMALMSVYGTSTFWSIFGFSNPYGKTEISSYGDDALYMIADV